MSDNDNNFSLREKKFAKTKMALLNEFVVRLKTTKFADISIKEICEAVEVSEATFYNYFPQKKDVVFYHKSLMGLRLAWVIEHELKGKSSFEIIQEAFNVISKDMQDRNLFYEVMTVMIAEDDKRCVNDVELSSVEKYYAFPELKGIEDIYVKNFEQLLRQQLEEAKSQKLIKEEVNIEEALISLFSIMIGVPLCMDKEEYPRFKDHYQTQLQWFWKAVGTEEIVR